MHTMAQTGCIVHREAYRTMHVMSIFEVAIDAPLWESSFSSFNVISYFLLTVRPVCCRAGTHVAISLAKFCKISYGPFSLAFFPSKFDLSFHPLLAQIRTHIKKNLSSLPSRIHICLLALVLQRKKEKEKCYGQVIAGAEPGNFWGRGAGGQESSIEGV